jgi:hypothetical protein
MAVAFRNQLASIAVALWALTSVVTANAGPLEDAEEAVKTGDYATALRLYRMLADQDNAVAQRRLGIMYLKGMGIAQNYAEAMKWMRVAARQGLAEAQNEVGILYQRGWGVERSDAEAAKWYRLAADQGLPSSETNLADSYALGRGVPQNFGEALKWYRIAADNGSPYAQNIVGIVYEHGISVAQDDAEAVRWYRRAANQIYDRPNDTWVHSPQYNFATMYASGRGIGQDYVRALMWFTLAAAFGDTKSPDAFGVELLGTSKLTALEQRDRLLGLMTSTQIAEAEKLTQEWRPHLIVTIEK